MVCYNDVLFSHIPSPPYCAVIEWCAFRDTWYREAGGWDEQNGRQELAQQASVRNYYDMVAIISGRIQNFSGGGGGGGEGLKLCSLMQSEPYMILIHNGKKHILSIKQKLGGGAVA